MIINKSCCKLLFDIVIFSISSSEISLDFNKSIRVVPLKYLMYYLTGINTRSFIPKQKYFESLKILNLYNKSFVNPFVDFALTFSYSSFNSFATSTSFVSFEVTFLFKFFSLNFLVLKFKFVFFTKSAISFLLAKLACTNLQAKLCAVKLLNSRVVIYLL